MRLAGCFKETLGSRYEHEIFGCTQWCIPEILEVRRLRQEDHSEFENSLEFEIRTGYWEHFLFILSVGE